MTSLEFYRFGSQEVKKTDHFINPKGWEDKLSELVGPLAYVPIWHAVKGQPDRLYAPVYTACNVNIGVVYLHTNDKLECFGFVGQA